MKILGMILFLLFSFTASADVSVDVSADCRSCMSRCPHATKDIKACDRGCPNVCSTAERAELAQEKKVKSCYACMAQCPHATKDLKACDRGCPGLCDEKKVLVKTVIEANKKAKLCNPGSQTPNEESESANP